MADAALARLHAAALTARCHNAFFRQKQLKALHDALRQDSNTLKDAIRADTRVPEQEAAREVALALDLVREHYAAIDPATELEREYRVAKGRDAEDQTTPWGVVYIEPLQTHTPLFSAVSALSAALSAGNCVALRLDNSLRALPTLLRALLTAALEPDTFAAVAAAPSADALAGCLQVLQDTHVEQPTHFQLVSQQRRVIAIVDRTADLASAAQSLVAARFGFGGRSPYAPDLVLVNEFVHEDFVGHVLRAAIPYVAGAGVTGPKSPSSSPQTLNAHAAITPLPSLTSLSALPAPTAHPSLPVSPITSLEHALSLLDADGAAAPLRAAYFFGSPATGKYLAQYTAAALALVNHIPPALLLGPAAPAHHAPSLDLRYTRTHFSRPAPVYVAPRGTTGEPWKVDASEALRTAGREIGQKKRAEWIAIGYFEQGILLGLGVYGVPLLACVGTGVFYGMRAGLRRFAIV
ncbi:Aldehyde/histidinol dehydrogenase [Boeremia exigua]|uniref:Aldehyde/histidinol dehydrogenase n=1 Tax=Boeremia exigua TaxID=749465 RepID=UPI001E8D28E1|nr:Aldehyde/histidinol dehydrogenase [Boeremia exigua]KAH6620559.1 Aldehyde/histidinol dehydrogenase [Boeremia exigua]